jgi:isopentenyl-diphosphate delta-isomerase
MEDNVILVNSNNEVLGTMPKLEAHEKGVLHRAFSVFIFNENGELMLQQRAADKYHSPLLWTNTCCSHQRIEEENIQAGKRRLMEEMGFTVELSEMFSFIYKAPFDNGLTEHELDFVLIGHYNDEPNINKKEVENWKWISLDVLVEDIKNNPDIYTIWFKIIFEEFHHYIIENNIKKL